MPAEFYCRRESADALLTKPIDFDTLRNRIDSRLASAA
jgi:hypothetical protein